MTAEIDGFSVFCRRAVSDEADVMLSSRLFHSFRPAEANDRSPVVARHDGPTVT